MNIRLCFFFAALTLVYALCAAPGAANAEKIGIFTTAPPQKYLAERIGGERVLVSSLVPPGADAHSFEPRPAHMALLAESDLYFSLGGLSAFEDARLPGIAALNPELRIVDLGRGIARLHEKHGHDEKPHGHDHGQGDPHLWTSPRLAAEQAKIICAELAALDPAGAAFYAENLARFLDDSARLDAFFRSLFAGREGMRFLVFHPAWGYFARDYGLVQLAVEVDGKEPRAADLARLITLIRTEGIPFLLVSPQSPQRSARILAAESGIRLITADPLAENWLENMRAAGQAIAAALR